MGEMIKAEGDYIARMTESGALRVPLFGEGSIQVGDRSLTMRRCSTRSGTPSTRITVGCSPSRSATSR
ncbi:hypothetical protein GO496_10640 [Acidovorax citrulli]|nr:hypothetical protein [Paracidovorax citrulli]